MRPSAWCALAYRLAVATLGGHLIAVATAHRARHRPPGNPTCCAVSAPAKARLHRSEIVVLDTVDL